jgi:hypothetical protein
MADLFVTEEEVASTVRPEHFVVARSLDEAKALFKHSVEQVEIEVFSYCNRACWFCPNAVIDRRSANHFMPEELYLRIIGELAEISYDGVVTYSRYNEPLSDRVILTRIRQAREALPHATLMTYSNGDYLSRDYLDELRDAGLNALHIMTYLGNNERFSDTRALSVMTRRIAELGLRAEFVAAEQGVRYAAELRYEGMEVKIAACDFARVGYDRGGQVAIDDYRRTSWCPIVFKHFYVDWNGKVTPCCNIRSDVPEHEAHVVDDLSRGHSIFEAYASSELVAWRRGLFAYGPKEKPCGGCSHAAPQDTSKMRDLIDRLADECGLRPMSTTMA